jgi:hypothetical protein
MEKKKIIEKYYKIMKKKNELNTTIFFNFN